MGRHKKIIINSEENTMETGLPAVKQLVRWLSGATDDAGHDAITSVDLELDAWIKRGYTLFETHYVGTDAGAIGIVYILVANG